MTAPVYELGPEPPRHQDELWLDDQYHAAIAQLDWHRKRADLAEGLLREAFDYFDSDRAGTGDMADRIAAFLERKP